MAATVCAGQRPCDRPSIELDRTVEPVVATGGVLPCTSPWAIEEETLTVISYIHRTGL